MSKPQILALFIIAVALPKGALLKDSIRLLQAVGLDFSAFLDSANRQLQIQDPSGTAQHFQLHDVLSCASVFKR